MMAKKALKTKLRLNNKEAGYLNGCAEYARYAWNWGLSMHDELFRADKSPRINSGEGNIKSAFRAAKTGCRLPLPDGGEDRPFVPTHYFVHPHAARYPSAIEGFVFMNMQKAVNRYWDLHRTNKINGMIAEKKARGRWSRWLRKQLKAGRRGAQVNPGYPQYKSKDSTGSFSVNSSVVKDGRIFVGAARGSEWAGHGFRMAEAGYIPDGQYKTTTFSRQADGSWYVSVLDEFEPEPLETTGEIIGVDIGVATAVATSDGTMYANNRRLAQHEKRLKMLQQKLSRQQRHSSNWKKTKVKIGRVHAKIARARSHDRHNITADLVYGKRPSLIRVEDLQVKNMTAAAKPKPSDEDGTHYLPNKKRQKAGLNRAMLEVAPYELRRQIEYKAAWSGIDVEAVPPAYTSQTCSRCGHVAKENRPSQAEFCCVSCGYTAHADVNAACVIRDTTP